MDFDYRHWRPFLSCVVQKYDNNPIPSPKRPQETRASWQKCNKIVEKAKFNTYLMQIENWRVTKLTCLCRPAIDKRVFCLLPEPTSILWVNRTEQRWQNTRKWPHERGLWQETGLTSCLTGSGGRDVEKKAWNASRRVVSQVDTAKFSFHPLPPPFGIVYV